MGKSSRNSAIANGVMKLSRSASYKKKGLYKRKRVAIAKKAAEVVAPKTKQIGGDNNGKTRSVAQKASRFYPAVDVAKPCPVRKAQRAMKLRASLTPGTIAIMLSGAFRGHRVVVLKHLASGLLLVNGPFGLNGVPLRRVNAAYVIATSTKVDVSKVDVSKFDDKYFAHVAAAAPAKSDAEFLNAEKPAKTTDASRVADQKVVDKALMAAISPVSGLAAYLTARFALSKGQYPHTMKF